MKRLRKLEINPARLIKNGELLKLRGGSGICYYCRACSYAYVGKFYGSGLTEQEAVFICNDLYPSPPNSITCYTDENYCY